MQNKKLLIGISVLLLIAAIYQGSKGKRHSIGLMSKKEVQEMVDSVKKETSSIAHVSIKKDDKNPGQEIYSVVFITKETKKSKESLINFVFEFFDSNEKYSSLSAVVFEDAVEKKQYRVILGQKIVEKAHSIFDKKEPEKLVDFLKNECPKSDPRNLANFCNISDNL